MTRAGGALLLTACLLVQTWPAGAAEAPGPVPAAFAALGGGSVSLSLRYRFEGVWDDDPRYTGGDGYASTLRTALSYRSAAYEGFSAAVEFENVADLGLDAEHNNLGAAALGNGVSDHPAVADPAFTEVNQVYLRYEGIPNTSVDLGRRELSIADERYVGPVGWRQNHQSFDGLFVRHTSVPRTTVVYAFLHNVNRIFGDDHPLAGHAFEASVSVNERLTVAPYIHHLDYVRSANAGLSTTTVGARATGALSAGQQWRVPFHLEGATQMDAGDNPGFYNVPYVRVEAGVERGALSLGAGYEVLGAEAGEGAFATPLATLHKWNGWADRFLATPADGLADLSVTARARKNGVTGVVVFHLFTSDDGDTTYGREVDADVSYRTSWKQTLGAKLALYDSETHSTDTQKLWLYTAYGF